MKNVYTIPEIERENIIKLLNRFSKKSEAYGKLLSYKLGEPYAKERKIYDMDSDPINDTMIRIEIGKDLVEVFDLTIESEIIRKDGYIVVAKIEHLDGGNVVNVFGEEAKPEWATMKGNCDHCGNKRHRRLTFIVRSEAGSEKQVGRSCLKDYCGINPDYIIGLSQLQDLILCEDVDHYDFKAHGTPKAYDVVRILALSKLAINKQGYVKSNERNSNREVINSLCDSYTPTEIEMVEAQDMAKGILNIETWEEARDAMLDNVWALLKSGYCKATHFGYLAYAPVAYEKYIERLKRKAEREAQLEAARKSSSYVGEIGKRITMNVSEMKLLTSWETMYGYTFLYKIIDNIGNTLIWYASKAVDCENVKAIKATIKGHTEHDGVKQTVVTRCKVIEAA